MNWLDVSLIVLFAISLISGVREGFSRSGFGLMALLAAFVTAAWLAPENAKAFLAIFVAAICVSALIAFVLGKMLRRTAPQWVDAAAGGAFGLVNAAILAVIAVLALMAFAPKIPREYVANSTFAPYALEAARTAAAIVPAEVKARVESSYAGLVQIAPPKVRQVLPPAEI